jgi:hypothetical protein
MGQRPRLAIGVCTRDLATFNAHCAPGLERLIYPSDFDYTLIVVENRKVASGHHLHLNVDVPVRLFHEDELGLSAARNRVLDEADRLQVDWLALVDDDMSPLPDWLCEYTNALSAAPTEYFFHGQFWFRFTGNYAFAIHRDAETLDGLRQQPMRFGGGNLLLGKLLFSAAALGLRFDPRFDACGGEDTDFRRQAAAQNIKPVPVPRAIVQEIISAKRAAFSVSFRRMFDHGVAGVVLLKKYASVGQVIVGMSIQLPWLLCRILLLWLQVLPALLRHGPHTSITVHRALAASVQFLGTVFGLMGYRGSYYSKNRNLAEQANA